MSTTDGTFSILEKVKVLFKKNLGKASTTTSREWYSEKEFNARAGVHQGQIYSSAIPKKAWVAMGHNTLADWKNWRNSNMDDGTKKESDDYPITYYHNYTLQSALPSQANSRDSSFRGPDVSGVLNILKNTIPTDFDPVNDSYMHTVTDSTGATLITGGGGGDWYLDTDAGILTFFEYNVYDEDAEAFTNDVHTRVDSANPPRISFFRYSGQTGSGWAVKSNHMSSVSNSVVIGKPTLPQNHSPDYNLDVSGTARFSSSVKAHEFEAESDVMLKHEIKPIEDTLSKLDEIKGVSFKWNDTGRESYGIVAQDIEKILPSAVKNNPNGYKTVNYNSVVGFLVQTCKELNDKIKKLEEK